MPEYVRNALQRLHHTPKVSPQYSPHPYTPIFYSTKGTQQYATKPDSSALLSPPETQYIQSVV